MRGKYYYSWCKTCFKEYVAKRDRTRDRKVRREYFKLRERNDAKAKERAKKRFKRYKEKYPERLKANSLLNYARRKGIIKMQTCEKCSEKRTHAHHDDYSKPLDVRWLCSVHHKEHHSVT